MRLSADTKSYALHKIRQAAEGNLPAARIVWQLFRKHRADWDGAPPGLTEWVRIMGAEDPEQLVDKLQQPLDKADREEMFREDEEPVKTETPKTKPKREPKTEAKPAEQHDDVFGWRPY